MKSMLTATVLAFSVAAAEATPLKNMPSGTNADLRSLIEEFAGGDSVDVSTVLTELIAALGLSDSAAEDIEQVLANLADVDFQALVDEIGSIREELMSYRYRYVGLAEGAVWEDDTLPAFWNLSAMCVDTFGEGARLARTGDVAYSLESGEFPLGGVERAIFRSSLPIPYRDGLYDTLVSAPVDIDGLVVYDGTLDRFEVKNPDLSASVACSASDR